MPNFIRKSRIVEAIQFDGKNLEEMNSFIYPDGVPEGKPFGKIMFVSCDGRVLTERESENDSPVYSFFSQNITQKVFKTDWVVRNPRIDVIYQFRAYSNSMFQRIFHQI